MQFFNYVMRKGICSWCENLHSVFLENLKDSLLPLNLSVFLKKEDKVILYFVNVILFR